MQGGYLEMLQWDPYREGTAGNEADGLALFREG